MYTDSRSVQSARRAPQTLLNPQDRREASADCAGQSPFSEPCPTPKVAGARQTPRSRSGPYDHISPHHYTRPTVVF